jgi:serine protease Do
MSIKKFSGNLREWTARRATILGLGVLVGAGGYGSFVAVERTYAEASTAAVVDATTAPRAVSDSRRTGFDVLTGFADLAEAATPAVVQIDVRESAADGLVSREQQQIPEEFRRFFRLPQGGSAQPDMAPRYGAGTGFIISSDGYIVTNNHVAGDADEITVTLNDHRSFHATLVGSDPTTDVAVIKIDATDLPVLHWGSSSDLRVGEWIMTIGNPGVSGSEQLDYTVTNGIVSAKDRPLRLLGRSLAEDPEYGTALAGYAIENFIQTDAVINPGNSGGPMLDMRGEVVGVNSAIASTDGRFQGYGFAIPADLVRRVASDLIEYGRVRRPWLGVSVVSVTPEDAEVYELPTVEGVLVQSVSPDGPAEAAGMRQEDVIVSVEGVEVMNGGTLQQIIAERKQHEKVELTIYRDGKLREVTVELGEAPLAATPVESAASAPRHATERLGLELGDLTQARAARLGFERAGGALILSVEPMGPASRKGVAPGLLITEVNGKDVGNADAAASELARVKAGKIARLRVVASDGQNRVINVRAR